MNELLDQSVPREALLLMDGSGAYQWRLAELSTQIRQEPDREARRLLRKHARRVLDNYKAHFPHLHTCQI